MLVRFRDLTVAELAPQLHEAARVSHRELKKRYYPGTIRRLGSDSVMATQMVERAIRQDAQDDVERNGRATYAISRAVLKHLASTPLVGVGTIRGGLKSYIHKLPIRPSITDHLPTPLVRLESILGHANVTAWISSELDWPLTAAYAGLLSNVPEGYTPWTVEPTRSGPTIHAELRQVMRPVDWPYRYDIGEDRNSIPPVSQAYVSSFSARS